MINLEDYKDLIGEIRKLSNEEARCEVKASEGPTLSVPSGSEVIEDTEYLDWYEN